MIEAPGSLSFAPKRAITTSACSPESWSARMVLSATTRLIEGS